MLQFFDTLEDPSGNALVGATVAVTAYPSGGAVQIFSTNGTTSPIANSTMISDITGQVSCFLPDGAYIMVYSYQGTPYKTRAPVQILDPMGFVAATDTGSVNSIIVTGSQYPAQKYTGLKLEVKVAATNNSGAVTINYQGDGGVAVTQPGGNSLVAGMVQANGLARFEYDGTVWQIVGSQSQPFYARTAQEITAGVLVVDSTQLPGVPDRYQINGSPGTTDMTNGIKAAYSVAKLGVVLQFLASTYAITDTCITIATADKQIVIRGVPLRTAIINKSTASSGKHAIRAIDAQYFDIRGLMIFGVAGSGNLNGISIETAGGQRCAFFYISDVICNTNGGGIHVQGANTFQIERYQYWPSSGPAGGSIDVNGQPYGFLADGSSAVNGCTLRDFNIGGLNTIANGGCGIKVDGSASVAPFQSWEIDDVECEIVNGRSVWFRNVNIGTLRSAFTENSEIRFDQNCVRCSVHEMESAASGTVVVDGTQSLGGCRQLTFIDCQAGSFTADSANAKIQHIGSNWGLTFTDNSQDRGTIKTEGAGSAYVVDSLNKVYRFKPAGTARASTTTLADDPDLIVTNLAKGTYLIRCYMQFFGTTSGAQGFKFALRIGGGITGASWIIPFGIVNAALSNPNVIAPANTTDAFATISTALNDEITFDAIVSSNGVGDIALQWAQNSSSVNNTNLSAASWMTVERIA